ncbi:MAG TPA: glucose-1-phosphate adenylyltransferase [Sphingobacteriaceae bacterium]|nr:glucose-1-phosphate adenylyltransferase [Sphingobacteriaceae bacterium]
MEPSVISIVLGGGQGARLYPLTSTRSKPAVPIAGKYRLVDIPISNCLNSGYNRIFVLTQFNSASLNKHIKNTYHFSIFSKGFVDILAAEQTPAGPFWYEGTADAVRKSLRYLQPFHYEYVLVLSGDQLYQIDFQEMVEKHVKSGAELTIATIPVSSKDAPGFGILKADDNNRIVSFTEKPSLENLPGWESQVNPELEAEGRVYLASMGIYIFNKSVLKEVLKANEQHDFGKEVIPQAIQDKRFVSSYLYDGYWTDIGNIESFFEANIGLTDDIPQFNLFDDNTIYTRPRNLPPSKITGTTLDRAVIAEGCIICATQITRSVIGVRSRIGTGSIIQNTYVMGSDYYQNLEELRISRENNEPTVGIGDRCFINNAIIDKNCSIGNDVRIDGSKLADGNFDNYFVKDHIVVIKQHGTIPNNTIIE